MRTWNISGSLVHTHLEIGSESGPRKPTFAWNRECRAPLFTRRTRKGGLVYDVGGCIHRRPGPQPLTTSKRDLRLVGTRDLPFGMSAVHDTKTMLISDPNFHQETQCKVESTRPTFLCKCRGTFINVVEVGSGFLFSGPQSTHGMCPTVPVLSDCTGPFEKSLSDFHFWLMLPIVNLLEERDAWWVTSAGLKGCNLSPAQMSIVLDPLDCR